jgi:phosphatidylglycerol lysyltransferase
MPDPRRQRLKTAVGVAASLVIAGLAIWVLYRTFQRIEPADVLRKMGETSHARLLLAGACAAGAYLTIALYEGIAVRYVKRWLGIVRPAVTALIAFPIGHALGQMLLSASAMRFRMYTPLGFSAVEVGATVLMCALPYALAFGLLVDLALVLSAERLALVFGVSAGWLLALGILGLAKDLGYAVLVVRRKAPIRLGGWAVHLPTPRMTLLQGCVGIIDIGLVSSILYLLLPDSMGLGFLPFVAIYLAAILAGSLSHVPAGFGVLESVLLLLLPHVPPAELLAAVLLYRVIYEVIPLLVALCLWGAYELIADDGMRVRMLRLR